MQVTLKYAATALVIMGLVLGTRLANAQNQGAPTLEQPPPVNLAQAPSPLGEGLPSSIPQAPSLSGAAQQAVSSMTGDQQSAATKALCSALSGNYKDAATAGVSGLTDPKVLLTAATSYSSVMHISVSSATSLLKGFAIQHSSDILTSCAASNATSGVTSALPGASGVTSGVPGIGGLPKMP
jgi:hypothetical protein